MRRTLGLLILFLTTNVAHAERQTMVLGSGQSSYGSLVAAATTVPPGRKSHMNTPQGTSVNEYSAYQDWLMGFISGFNSAFSSDVSLQVAIVDLPGMDLWMRNWCNKNPTKTVFEGASAFIGEMRGLK